MVEAGHFRGADRSGSRIAVLSRKAGAAVAALMLGLAAALVTAGGAASAATPMLESGDSVYVGPGIVPSGSAFLFPVWKQAPADPSDPGTPDYWAYCIEQAVSAYDRQEGTVGAIDSFIGSNYFAQDPEIPGKVLWVLGHSYPALSLAELADAADIPGLTFEDAISGTTTAIWRYTDVNYDATYAWISQNAEDLYWYLVEGANAGSGMTPGDFDATISIAAPSASQRAGSLVGPFVVSTNQPTATVTVAPDFTLTDAAGAAIDGSAVVDGQQLYLDARAETTAGSATLVASVEGSSVTGMVVTLPKTPGGTPTAVDHGQSLILVAPAASTTEAEATVMWFAEADLQPTPAGAPELAETGAEPTASLLLSGFITIAIGVALLARVRADREAVRDEGRRR